jgi:hypothetical protein
MKVPNIMFGKFTVAQSELAKHLLHFFLSVLANFYLYLQCFTYIYFYLGVGTSHGCVPGNYGGIQVLAGPAPSSQTAGSLLIPPGWQSRPEKFSKMLFR